MNRRSFLLGAVATAALLPVLQALAPPPCDHRFCIVDDICVRCGMARCDLVNDTWGHTMITNGTYGMESFAPHDHTLVVTGTDYNGNRITERLRWGGVSEFSYKTVSWEPA